jgi:cobalamin biosynthesis Mg chelatase CobN
MYKRIEFESEHRTIKNIDNYIHEDQYELYSYGLFILGLDSEAQMLDYIFSEGCALNQCTVIKNNRVYLEYNKGECA